MERMSTTLRGAATAGRVVVDYRSSDGPTVTHIRGMLLSNSLSSLRALNLEERYLDVLPASARTELNGIIASSWVEIEVAMLHFQVFEGFEVPDEKIEELGRPLAGRITDTWFGAVVRGARNSGIEAMPSILKQNDRNFARMYKGGRTMVTEYGPKEMVIEDNGNPLLSVRPFRSGYLGFMKGLAALFTKSAFVKTVPMQAPHPHGTATRFSWV
jgi:hypothetical protein